MKALAIIGRSGTGKTALIRRLVRALGRRGLRAAVVKHCGHGFELGPKDKDSNIFLRAGAEAVVLAGPKATALVRRHSRRPSDRDLAELCDGADIVLIEGGRVDRGIPKIEVLRKGIAEQVLTPAVELLAVVADFPVDAEVPVFRPTDIAAIAALVGRSSRSARRAGGSRAKRRPDGSMPRR
jgi:molybdopterin-guanine dinucleotide biosynthesis protein B